MDDEDLDKLAIRALHGSQENAWTTLAQVASPRLLGITWLYFRDQNDVDEAIQQTWINIMRYRNSYRGNGFWLFAVRTLFHVIYSMKRTRDRRRRREQLLGEADERLKNPGDESGKFVECEEGITPWEFKIGLLCRGIAGKATKGNRASFFA